MNCLYSFVKHIVDLVFPQSPALQALERLSIDEFRIQARRPLEDPPEGIYSLFSYKDPLVRKALWELKYKGNRQIARLFGELLFEEINAYMLEEGIFHRSHHPLIIPLPLSRERLYERGWNQSEMIAQNILVCDHEKKLELSTTLLKKIHHTYAQTKLSKAARLKNLKNCFCILNPEKLKNKTIVLIDDVTTTGATISEAKKTLLAAGAKSVIAMTVAH